VQITSNIAPLWLSKARKSSTPLTILSPYLSGNDARLLVANKPSARIYTLFDLEVFASGASSLDLVASLVTNGSQVFHLENLHAKVVMNEDGFVCLGSQNLTRRGKSKNRELSVHLFGDTARSQARELVEPWLKEAKQITPDMVADMKASLVIAQEAYQQFKKTCADQHKVMEENERERDESQRAKRRLRENLTKSISKSFRLPTAKFGTVRYLGENHTLSIQNDSNLLTWGRGRDAISLQNLKRYLCVLDGDFGWARVASGRITKISRIIRQDGFFPTLPNLHVVLSSAPRQMVGLPPEANLAVKVKHDSTTICTVPMAFNLKRLRTFTPIVPQTKASTKNRVDGTRLAEEVKKWINANPQKFKQLISVRVTQSFHYAEGSKLAGGNANTFFGPVGTRCKLELIVDGSKHILAATRLD